ncbi:transcription initiation factor TFIID subunit 12 [Folsomia candida]|uniref:transcription initiation factor TFIID subunit 12 n=1 Tax=Folsomia candida TaxID=158441 RepID=UPI000B8FCD32|nr:transcription initiation factor TFIID subunit 12 [Folsomia candida]
MSTQTTTPPGTTNPTATTSTPPPAVKVLTRKGLQELVKNVDPNEQLDEDVEDLLLSYADEYMESVMEGAAVLASHRKSNVVEIKDIHTHLERTGQGWIPGFGSDELKPYKRVPVMEAHKQRVALIKKSLKKY